MKKFAALILILILTAGCTATKKPDTPAEKKEPSKFTGTWELAGYIFEKRFGAPTKKGFMILGDGDTFAIQDQAGAFPWPIASDQLLNMTYSVAGKVFKVSSMINGAPAGTLEAQVVTYADDMLVLKEVIIHDRPFGDLDAAALFPDLDLGGTTLIFEKR